MFGKTRQAWYERKWSGQKESVRDSIVVKRVQEIRQQMPRIGGRKLHYLLTDTLQKHDVSIGRDKLFDLLEEYGLLVRRRKRRKAITTDSNHPYYKYPNLIRDLEVVEANHLWVSDITYISLQEGFCYLSLITDAYSRKIVGYHLCRVPTREGPLKALIMALSQSPKAHALVHHSDRGSQYCCHEYTSLLQSKGISISMTEKGDPYENAIAERVNGILKTEFALDQTFCNYEQASLIINNAIDVYNQQRPHLSCNYLTPNEAHQQQGLLKTKWKRRSAMV